VARPVRVTDLRRSNRASVFRTIVMNGETNRTTLAAELDLSVATVTNVVTDLLRGGVIQEAGSVPSNGGRPTTRLKAAPDAAYFIGADVGEHGVEAALFDLDLRTVNSVFVPVAARSTTPDQIQAVVAESVTRLIDAHPRLSGRIKGVGLGLPGIVDTNLDGATTIYAQSLGWPPVALSRLRPPVDLPVLADNGAKTFAAAESWSGAARGVSHSLVVLIGRGLGVGIVSGGRILRGTSSSAGEWGHTKIAVNGRRCNCGGLGCIEAYVGGASIRSRAEEMGLQVAETDEETLTSMLELADQGSSVPAALIGETIEFLAVGLANLVNIFNPEQIVIGGWAGHQLLSARKFEIAEAVRTHSLDRPGAQVSITGSTQSVDPVALGAALLPLERFIEGTLSEEEAA